MATYPLQYYVPEYEKVEDAHPFQGLYLEVSHGTFERCAEAWHALWYGVEVEWPVTIVILSTDGRELGRHVVDMLLEPSFIVELG